MRQRFIGLFAALLAFTGPVAAYAAPATIIVQKDGITPVDASSPFAITCPDGTCTSAGGAATIANGADAAEGNTADSPWSGSGSATVIAALKYIGTSVNGAIPAGTNVIGKVSIDQATPGTTNAVQSIAGTTGGATAYGLQTAASTNSTSVKGSAGVLYGMNLLNTTTTIYYLRMYDASSAPTCSSATNFSRTWPIPPAAASGGAGGVAVKLPEMGVQFSSGIAFCVTGGPSSTDNTNAATGVFINLDYK